MDRISDLPQSILHQILSYLSPREAARTSVLSKTWLQAWSSSPILVFNESSYDEDENGEPIEGNKHDFLSYVHNTLVRYRTHNLRINKFEFVRMSDDHISVHRIFDEWIGTSIDLGVRELYISVERYDLDSRYILPQTIFTTAANALTDLTIVSCIFPQSYAGKEISFPFLKTLRLYCAHIDDSMLQKLLSNCPSLEEITFQYVLEFEKFKVSNLGQLKILDISSSDDRVIKVDIEDAPNLHFLCYYNFDHGSPCYLKVGSAQNLKHLVLKSVIITRHFIDELSTKFPLLEVLNITSCNGFERINISGHFLKHLLFEKCENLVEINITAPRLLTLHYEGDKVLSLSLVNTPGELMTAITIDKQDIVGWSRITWLHQFRNLLKSMGWGYISVVIWNEQVAFETYLDPISNPLPLENSEPDVNYSSFFAAIVDTLFSSCRPSTISGAAESIFRKFLCYELILATRNLNCCSSGQESKCWRHYLMDIEVEIVDYSQGDHWQPIPWEMALDESILRFNIFRYILKWRANLNTP